MTYTKLRLIGWDVPRARPLRTQVSFKVQGNIFQRLEVFISSLMN